MNRLKLLNSVPDSERIPLNRVQSEAMLKVTMIQHVEKQTGSAESFLKKSKNPFEIAVMLTRLADVAPELTFDYHTVVFFGILANNVAEAVMWSLLLKHRTDQLGRPYLMADFADDFPTGVPNETALHGLWRDQKIKFKGSSDNLIDTAEPWTQGYFDRELSGEPV